MGETRTTTEAERTEADRKERQRIYERTRDGLDASARAMSGDYDRALLTLSSAFLGGSLALTNQIVKLDVAIDKPLLYFAWGFFALTIVLTLSGFLHSLFYIERLRSAAERYYIKQDESAWDVSVRATRVAMRYNVSSGVCFGIGVALLAAFIAINVNREGKMQFDKDPKIGQKSIPQGSFQRPAESAPVQQPVQQQPVQQQPAQSSGGSKDDK
jgi:hypothetical protein